MTETKRTKPGAIPTREEFHKEFAGFISEKDFETDERFAYRTYGYSYPTRTECKNRKNNRKAAYATEY